jgi:NAD(P)-dependent dehydrogenase (short-subunit alcohol dehydrogenase family)
LQSLQEGAYVFITGRKQEQIDKAVKVIGRNVIGVQGDASNLDDLDRLFDTVKREKGKIDVLFASAGRGEALPLGQITEEHFSTQPSTSTRAERCSRSRRHCPSSTTADRSS